jgi:hypothetical protein
VDNFWAAFFILYLIWITSDTLSFHTWSIFLKAFPEHIDRHTAFQYNEEKKDKTTTPTQLPSMINRMAKLDVSVLTFFCVRGFVLNIDYLIALTKIDSLGVLVLERSMAFRIPADDDIPTKDVLNWGRSVRESGAFKKLKVLAFVNLGPEKSAVLKAVSDFPALTLVGVYENRARCGKQPGPFVKGMYGSWYPTHIGKDMIDASLIWSDDYTTKAQKMEQLYEHLPQLSWNSQMELSLYRSVSMSYSREEGRHCHFQDGGVAWYHRELEQNATYSITHSEIENRLKDKSDVEEGSHHKKRKVREGKGIDVGSLLGSFS